MTVAAKLLKQKANETKKYILKRFVSKQIIDQQSE